MEHLTYEAAPFIRKPSTFNQAKLSSGPFRIKIEKLKDLIVFDAKMIGIRTPFCSISDKMPQYFILTKAGKKYLVKTEGYDYCRYVLQIKII